MPVKYPPWLAMPVTMKKQSSDPDQTSYQRKRNRLADKQSQNAVAGEAESFQHCDFPRTLADRHRHSVRRHQQDGKHHRQANTHDESLDIPQHPNKA